MLSILKKVKKSCPKNQRNQLTIVHQTIEEYAFPKNVRLIYGSDILSYCNPMKIKEVLRNIHEALESKGRFVGNFYSDPNRNLHSSAQSHEIPLSRLLGAFYIDKNVVQAIPSNL